MAVFDVSTLGTPNNRITFNNFNGSPLYRCIRRAPTRREIREFDIPLPESLGVADFQTLIGKSYFIIEGKMYPNDEIEFNAARRALRKVASLPIEQNDSSSAQGYVPYNWTEDQPKQLLVKVLYVDMDEQTKRGLIQPFRLLCKIKYPVVTDTQSKTLQLIMGTTANPTGGVAIPMLVGLTKIGSGSQGTLALPTVLPAVLGASPQQAGNTINNTGDLDSFPTITIYGPLSKPRITNLTTGEYLELDVTLNTVNDSAIFSYNQDSLSIVANNLNAYGKLTSGSTLFKIQPGTNSFQLTGTSTGSGASCIINFFPTYPIS